MPMSGISMLIIATYWRQKGAEICGFAWVSCFRHCHLELESKKKKNVATPESSDAGMKPVVPFPTEDKHYT